MEWLYTCLQPSGRSVGAGDRIALLFAEARLEELAGSADGLAEAQRVFSAEQAAFAEALASFAPGLGAGKFLGAAFNRHWKALAKEYAVETGPQP